MTTWGDHRQAIRADGLLVAQVFASLTEATAFSRRFGLPVEIEPCAGGSWSVGGGPVGRVGDVEDGRRLRLQEDSGVATWELTNDTGKWLFDDALSREKPR